MTSTTTLNLVDGVRIVVPDSLDLITPYVLLEQQDWFEDEIKFLRRLLKPGQAVIDIGANYGVYTLSPWHRQWGQQDACGPSSQHQALQGCWLKELLSMVLPRLPLIGAPYPAPVARRNYR